jgi:TonB family protein
MKICPNCQQQYPNGFQYCPNDTELLLTQDEYVRRTRPIATPRPTEPAKPSAIEFVPITNPFPPEEPAVAAKAQNRVAQEPPKPTPFRQTETIRTHQPAARNEAQPFVTAPPVNGNTHTQRPAQSNGVESVVPPSTFGFTVPEQKGLIASLSEGLKNIGDIFKGGKVEPGATGDFNFLLAEQSLVARVGSELGTAWNEFRRDPRRFVVEFARGEGSNRYRRNALLAGSEMALVGYVTIYFIVQALSSLKQDNGMLINLFFAGFALYLTACYFARGFLLYKLINRVTAKLAAPKLTLEILNWAPLAAVLLLAVLLSNYNFYCRIFPNRCLPPEEEVPEEVIDVTLTDPTRPEIKMPESAKAQTKQIGGSKSTPKPAAGGGGGGRNQPTPPSKGVPPQMAMTPQIIPPNPEPPKIKNPTLVVPVTIYGDPSIKMPKGQIGDPLGVPAPPSSGPGSGAGIGRGSGTGVGGGQGGGAGPGRGGNTGGGDMSLGGGRSVEPMSATLRPTILYKERAKYTEEARTNKVQGTVTLSVEYLANGTIGQVRVVRGLPDGLSESAIEAAKRIRFNPAVKNGVPVSVRGNIEFNFTLY